MSMRICCGTDMHKPHHPECEKEVEWRRKLNEKVRTSDKREKTTKKSRERQSTGK